MDWDDPRFKEWRRRNAAVLGITAGIVGDHLLREYLLKKGLTPFSIFTPVIIARLGVEVVGSVWAYIINGEDGIEDWMYASNTMFSWWGAEDTMLGSPLNLIPNPVGIGEVLNEAVDMQWKEMQKGTQPGSVNYYIKHLAPIVWREATGGTFFNRKGTLPQVGHPTSWI